MNFNIKPATLLLVLIVLAWMPSCRCMKKTTDSFTNGSQLTDFSPNSIEKTDINATNIKGDTFEVEAMSVEGNFLKLEISYGGGCGTTDLKLFYHDNDATTMPAQLILLPQFSDNDPCRAIVRDTLFFDLSAFASVARSGGITIQLNGFDKKTMFALPLH